MNLAYITTKFPFGNAESFLQAEVQCLAQHVEKLLIVPARPAGSMTKYHNLNAEVLALGVFQISCLFLALREIVTRPFQVARLLWIILASPYRLSAKAKNLVIFPKALAVARAFRDAQIDHIHAQWLSTPSTIALVASTLTGIPWSCTAHRFDIFADNLVNKKAASAKFIRVISERNRNFLLQRIDRRFSQRCQVVHLGVQVSPELPKQHAFAEHPTILCPANLLPVKGHEYLIRAVSEVRSLGIQLRCDLAGEGPLRRKIESMIRDFDLQDAVVLRGHVNHDRMLAELHEGVYGLVVLPSTERPGEHEGIPVSLMEAMAAGVPCISTRTGSIPELIDETCGLLVQQQDALALANAIVSLVDGPKRYGEIARNARQRIKERFDAAVTTQALLRLLENPEDMLHEIVD